MTQALLVSKKHGVRELLRRLVEEFNTDNAQWGECLTINYDYWLNNTVLVYTVNNGYEESITIITRDGLGLHLKKNKNGHSYEIYSLHSCEG